MMCLRIISERLKFAARKRERDHGQSVGILIREVNQHGTFFGTVIAAGLLAFNLEDLSPLLR